MIRAMPAAPSPRHRPQRSGLIGRDRKSDTVLVIVDMISCWQFPDGHAVEAQAAKIAPRIARLKARSVERGIPVVYANDNSGQWRSDFKFVVAESLASATPGADITRRLEPRPEDYFVLKPKHSAFFATPLEILLDHLRAKRLIVTGVTGDQCVLSTAADARMRDLDVVVPADGIASLTPERNHRALAHLREVLDIKTPPTRSLRL